MLNEMLEKDVRFRNVERKAARVIEAATGAKFDMKEEEETVDMCQALKEIVEDATRERMQIIARRMLQKGQDSVAYIAEMTGLSEEQVMALKMDL